MALDYITNGLEVPEYLDFTTRTEPTRMAGKKYVINNDTDEVIGIVGSKFNSVTHKEFFDKVCRTMSEQLGDEAMEGANVKWNNARNGAFAMLDATLPATKALITTDKQQTEISQRVIALHGVDGSCSNMVFFGAIDFFCTNGMITGDYNKVRRKNTSNFCMNRFIQELNQSSIDFYEQADQLQTWAKTELPVYSTKGWVEFLSKITKSDQKAMKMIHLVQQEVSKRGRNVFALYSAFTNYASYADDRNGFNLRNTGKDTASQSMWAIFKDKRSSSFKILGELHS